MLFIYKGNYTMIFGILVALISQLNYSLMGEMMRTKVSTGRICKKNNNKKILAYP